MSPHQTVIYGGTFDPPHMGHVLTVAWLLSATPADVWVEPVFRHVLGKSPAPFSKRVAWVTLACAVFGPRVQVRQDEARAGASGATIDLIRYLQSRFPEREFVLAVGSDILEERHKWLDFAGIQALVPLIVLPRPGHPVDPAVKATVAPVLLPDVRSSDLRAAMAEGRSVEGLVPAAVVAQWTSHG